MNEDCKVSIIKITAQLIVFKEGVNTLSFEAVNYGVEYGTESSAESGAKQYFIKQRNVVRPTEKTEKGIGAAGIEFWFLEDFEF